MISVLQGASDDRHGDRLGAVQFQHARAFVGGGGRGHHVVDQQQSFPGKIGSAFKCAAHIVAPFLVRQVGLRRCRARAQQAVVRDGQA